jgi:hypothetical protein
MFDIFKKKNTIDTRNTPPVKFLPPDVKIKQLYTLEQLMSLNNKSVISDEEFKTLARDLLGLDKIFGDVNILSDNISVDVNELANNVSKVIYEKLNNHPFKTI